MAFFSFVGLLRCSSPFAQAAKRMFFVQVKAIKQITLMRVIRNHFGFTDIQASAEVFQSSKSLFDFHFFPQEVDREQIHRHVGLFNQPILNVPVWVDANHRIGKLPYLKRQVFKTEATFMLVLMLVCHAFLCVLTAYETSPQERTHFVDLFCKLRSFIFWHRCLI